MRVYYTNEYRVGKKNDSNWQNGPNKTRRVRNGRQRERKESSSKPDYCVDIKFLSLIFCLFSALRLTRSALLPGPSSVYTFGSRAVHSQEGYWSSPMANTGACPLRKFTPSSLVPSRHEDRGVVESEAGFFTAVESEPVAAGALEAYRRVTDTRQRGGWRRMQIGRAHV